MPDLEALGIPFANNAYPMWIYDRETRAFLEVNDAAIQAYGFSQREFLTMTLLDIRPAEDIPEFLRLTKNPRPLGQSTAEKWRHKSKDGKVFHVIITSWDLTFRGRQAELVLARREPDHDPNINKSECSADGANRQSDERQPTDDPAAPSLPRFSA